MKLHYSQTRQGRKKPCTVSVPYEITLLSNNAGVESRLDEVSVPYEITLLSNSLYTTNQWDDVSVPYEITLLSNGR